MIFRLISSLTVIFVTLTLWTSAMAANLDRRVFNSSDNKGAVHDVCLNDGTPVSVKWQGGNQYFVRVKKRYTGIVSARGYGEAMEIACDKKTKTIFYYAKPK